MVDNKHLTCSKIVSAFDSKPMYSKYRIKGLYQSLISPVSCTGSKMISYGDFTKIFIEWAYFKANDLPKNY